MQDLPAQGWLNRLTEQLCGWPPHQRRAALMILDACVMLLAAWLSYCLRFASLWPQAMSVALVATTPLLGVPLFLVTGQYRSLTRFSGQASLWRLGGGSALLVLLLIPARELIGAPTRSPAGWLLLTLLLWGGTAMMRLLVRGLLLRRARTNHDSIKRVLINGTGPLAVQLAAAIRHNSNLQVVAFIDPDPTLQGREIFGLPVYGTHELLNAAQRHRAQQVLITSPFSKRSERRRIVNELQHLGVSLLQVPSLESITSGRFDADQLQPMAIEDLIGRDEVPPRPELLNGRVEGQTVLITGAGGSIGSELCRQVARLEADRVILMDHSESSLHSIHQELLRMNCPCPVVPVLGSVLDRTLLKRLFEQWPVHTVLHCAAYKHVPMVECNPLTGLTNNVFGTRELVRAATTHGVQHLMLISTDKAVRPTGVMGASKRLAEMVVQAEALRQENSCNLGIVRFGNVIGSSGSVVPLFREQIANGGPICVTHPEITRYFMTITEAVQLILQAATLTEGNDVFLLDMGEPIKIVELARNMVCLAGLSVRDAENPHGEIAITFSGLRPGEKLYEELLVDGTAQRTSHPLIFRAEESAMAPELLDPLLDQLADALSAGDASLAMALLTDLVPEWNPQKDRQIHPVAQTNA